MRSPDCSCRGHRKLFQDGHGHIAKSHGAGLPTGTVKSGRAEVTVEAHAAHHVAGVRHDLVLGEFVHSVENFRGLTGD